MIQQRVDFIRVEQGDEGVFGTVLLDGHLFCVSLEPNVCIPEGEYIAMRYNSPKRKYEVWQLLSVPKRTNIQIHPGNLQENSEGCQLIAQYPGKLGKHRAILNSGETFRMFMAATAEADSLLVVVRSAYQGGAV